MLHFDGAGPDAPRLPEHGLGPVTQVSASAVVHAAGALVLALVVGHATTAKVDQHSTEEQPCLDLSRIVFVAADPRPPGGGGGGGGNRGEGPIRRAESPGKDALTLRPRPPAPDMTKPPPAPPPDVPAVPAVAVDAIPFASGAVEQLGLPSAGAPLSSSTGPGSGGGVGTGRGTGIGSGQGPGLGPGSGGGTGGGVYRPGGPVTSPRVLLEVKPKYTAEALRRRLQGTVELEVIVTREGLPSHVRVVRSIDPGGLDDEAVIAVMQWRFAPGRAGGVPVDVLVLVLLDFSIR